MSFKQRVRYLEKQVLRPFLQRFKTKSARRKLSRNLDLRVQALEARLAELEQIVQEDLGIRLAEAVPPSPPADGDER